jgi:hypothetical protein
LRPSLAKNGNSTMQLIITLSLISFATLYFVWSLLRPIFSNKKAGCSSGCGGCSTPPTTKAPGRLALPLIQVMNKIEA